MCGFKASNLLPFVWIKSSHKEEAVGRTEGQQLMLLSMMLNFWAEWHRGYVSSLRARQNYVAGIVTRDHEFPSLTEFRHCTENLSNNYTACYTFK
jgi:hypothetical protein